MRKISRLGVRAVVCAMVASSLSGCAADTGEMPEGESSEGVTVGGVVQPIATNQMVGGVALTNYYVPQERNLHGDGTRVTIGALGTFYRRFICQVAINGTGLSEGNRYVRRTDTDRTRTCEAASFAFSTGVITATTVIARTDRTLAVDSRRVPYGSSVFLESQCRWYRSEDRCGQCVRDATAGRDHIDVFTGLVQSPTPPIGTPSTRVFVTSAAHAFTDRPPTCGDGVCDPCDQAACPTDCHTPPPPPPPPPPFGTGVCGSSCFSILDCGLNLFCDASNSCRDYFLPECPSQQ